MPYINLLLLLLLLLIILYIIIIIIIIIIIFVSFTDLCFHTIVACSATHSENEGKYHQHVKFSGTNRSARSCCICGNQGKP